MKKGFIPIIFIVIGAVVIASATLGIIYRDEITASVVSVFKKTEEISIEKEAEDPVPQEEVSDEASAIEELKKEIEALKQQQEEQANKPPQIITKEASPKTLQITAEDLAPYLTGIIQISCYESYGSGSLWKTQQGKYMVLTNSHVIENPYPATGACSIALQSGDNRGYFPLYIAIWEKTSWNNFTDIAYVPLYEQEIPSELEYLYSVSGIKRINEFNYKISSLAKCQSEMPIGSPVAVVGFPSSGTRTEEYGETQVSSANRITTTGTISGQDYGVVKRLSYPNYFVSVKMDSGNSGGIAFSKNEKGLCLLGVPTWLNIGDYETQGMIQNIHNIMSNN